MALRALLFDVDGTLVDTEELHRGAFNEAFRLLSLGWDWGRSLYAELLVVSGGAERIAAYIDRLQAPDNLSRIACRNNALLGQHLGVSHAAANIMAIEPSIDVDRRRKGLDGCNRAGGETPAPELGFLCS